MAGGTLAFPRARCTPSAPCFCRTLFKPETPPTRLRAAPARPSGERALVPQVLSGGRGGLRAESTASVRAASSVSVLGLPGTEPTTGKYRATRGGRLPVTQRTRRVPAVVRGVDALRGQREVLANVSTGRGEGAGPPTPGWPLGDRRPPQPCLPHPRPTARAALAPLATRLLRRGHQSPCLPCLLTPAGPSSPGSVQVGSLPTPHPKLLRPEINSELEVP